MAQICRLKLSGNSISMLESILEEMRKYNFDSVNIPILISGILNSSETPDGDNFLKLYLTDLDVTPKKIDDTVREMISDHIAKLQFMHEYPIGQQSTRGSLKFFSRRRKKISSFPPKMAKEISETLLVCDPSSTLPLQVPVNADCLAVFERLEKLFGNQPKQNSIEPVHFVSALFECDNEHFKNLFNEFDAIYTEGKKYFKPEQIIKIGIIPIYLSSFLTLLNDKIDHTRPCEILCRDNETNQLWNILLKKTKRNAIIVGEPGVGKSAIIEKIAYEIVTGTCPPQFKNHYVLCLDVNSLIAGTGYRGDAEARIKDLISFLEEKQNVILSIDEVHTILGAGSTSKGGLDLANALKPILARGSTTVVAATTEKEYNEYFKKDGALSRRFEIVTVREPLAKNVYSMIKNKIDLLSEFHGVTISKEMVEYAIMIASCFAFEKKNPDKTLDLIDRAMVSAKRSNKSEVDSSSILQNFEIYFGLLANMDVESRKEIAYHEAGHYIVGKASGRLVQYNWLAVSIMPAEDYLGVTVCEINPQKIPFSNTDYFIDNIAFDLGGRVAQMFFKKDFTSGASSDLQSATQQAFDVVTRLGMGNDSISNRVYLNTSRYPMFSEKATDVINNEVNNLIERAFKRAQEIIQQNQDLLDAIVEALLKNLIMSEDELDKIWRNVIAKRQTS